MNKVQMSERVEHITIVWQMKRSVDYNFRPLQVLSGVHIANG